MLEYLEIIKRWSDEGRKIIMARVIKTWGSAPRPAGSMMFVTDQQEMAGSVSGGCVEGSVVKKAMEIINGGSGGSISFGVSDEEAWSVGLTCGGSIQLFLQEIDPQKEPWNLLIEAQSANNPSILITPLDASSLTNTILDEDKRLTGVKLPEKVMKEAYNAYLSRKHALAEHENRTYFIQIFPRKPKFLIIGAAHITVDLVKLGSLYGFETIVIDPRGHFADKTTFDPEPDQILQAYPSEVLDQFPLDAYTFCAILSHDPKIDDNALEILLPSRIAYIGALGSKKTHEKRVARLKEKGFSDELISKIRAPIGMPINAKSANEIALSVISEMIQVKNQFA